MKKDHKNQTRRTALPESGGRRAKALVRARRVPIQSMVLRTLYATGAIGIGFLAPNAVKIFKDFNNEGRWERKRLYDRIAQARGRLKRKGLVRITGSGRDTRVTLTDRGMGAVQAIIANHYQIPEPAFWDGRWRVIVFDVREKRRRIRNMLRRMLQAAGLYRLQDSVWLHPYPCDELVELLRAHLKSGVGEMIVFTADPFVGDSYLREHFSLKRQ